jgi:hypothetical protein
VSISNESSSYIFVSLLFLLLATLYVFKPVLINREFINLGGFKLSFNIKLIDPSNAS